MNTTFQLTQDQVRIENIQHVLLNGKDKTIFDVYTQHETNSFVFIGQYSLDGTIKRESTIKKKICLL